MNSASKPHFLNFHIGRHLPLWGVLLVLLLVLVGNAVFLTPLVTLQFLDTMANQNSIDPNYMNRLMSGELMNLNLVLMLITLPFLGSALGLWLAVKMIHKDLFVRLINIHKAISWKRIFWAFSLWTIIQLTVFVLDYFFISGADSVTYNGLSTNFFIGILISLVFLFIQSSTEELIFRSYLMQVVSSFFRQPIVAVLITGFLFGGLHMANPEVGTYGFWIMFAYYSSVGVFLALIVALDNRLELALGYHAANNIIGGVLMSYKGSALNTYALFTSQDVDMLLGFVSWAISALIFFFIAKKRFNFASIHYLFQPLPDPEHLTYETKS
ncbi:MAG: lysostaphin resistance A-like protein [Flavobacteriales bacterium]